jgi:membrane-associated phospholipid phosphatase
MSVRDSSGRRTRARIVAAVSAGLFLLLLATVLLRHGRAWPADLAIHRQALHHRSGGVRRAAVILTDTGAGVVPYALALAAGIISGSGRYGRAWSAVRAIVLLLAVQLLRLGLASAVGRPRPPATDWAVHASGFAFPSGHTATSATAAGILLYALWPRLRGVSRPAVAATLTTWAVAVGVSRVYLGVHWPTDVIGGWLFVLTLLGATAGIICSCQVSPQDAGMR